MNKYFIFSIAIAASSLDAKPSGFHLIQGEASQPSFPDANTCLIQTGSNAIIHWDGFSIELGETVRFDQLNSSSAVLNRVVGGVKSSLLGNLFSNGMVYLINPHGVLIGPDARIDVGSFIASTLDVLDADFMKGGELAFKGGLSGEIVNLGTICAKNGDVCLIAHQVDNQGKIEASQGTVGLAAGFEVLLQPQGKEKLFIRPTQQEGESVSQSGEIAAIQTEIKANGNPYDYAIRQSGKINAKGLEQRDGRIYLVAEKGKIEHSGTLVAQNGDQTGGEVRLLGEQILVSGAIDVSGDFGGGKVLIGGDFQGSNPEIPNAFITYVDKEAVIQADARNSGDGGRVIVWSDRYTAFKGNISAEGGKEQGDGGFVEVSGRELAFKGRVSTLAPQGKPGVLMLDPDDIVITSTAATDGPPPPPANFTSFTGSVAGTSNLNNADLVTALSSGSVLVTVTTNSGSGGSGNITVLEMADIIWGAPFTVASSTSLTLQADGDIYVAANILHSETGDINLNAVNNILVGYSAPGTPATQKVMVGSYNGATNLTTSMAGQIAIGDANSTDASQVGWGLAPIMMTSISGSITIDAATMTGVGNIVLTGGNMNPLTYAQIGHGRIGGLLRGTTGTITVTARGGGNVSLAGGTTDNSYVQIGHGGGFVNNAVNDVGGTITVTSTTGSVTLDGGAGPGTACAARIGHGGIGDGTQTNGTTFSGMITVTAELEVRADGGPADFNLAQIGHGISSTMTPAMATTHGISGDILVTSNTSFLSFKGGLALSQQSSSQVGHGGLDLFNDMADVSGNIDLNAPMGTLTLQGGSAYCVAQVGHGGVTLNGIAIANTQNTTGVITISTRGDILVQSGSIAGAINCTAMIGHGMNSTTFQGLQGNISVTSTNADISLHGDASRSNCIQIGHGGFLTSNTTRPISGAINVHAVTGSVQASTLSAGLVSIARIGHGSLGDGTAIHDDAVSGDITVTAGTSVLMSGGSEIYTQAQIGHGITSIGHMGVATTHGISGLITVTANTGDFSFDGGAVDGSLCQVGHGGFNFSNATTEVIGNIMLSAPLGTMSLQGGAAVGPVLPSAVVIGHGGASDGTVPVANTENTSGNITVSVRDDIGLTGGLMTSTALNYVQIGHGMNNGTFNGLEGPVSVTSTMGSISLLAGPGSANYAHIGHGAIGLTNNDTVPIGTQFDITGPITVSAMNGNVVVRGAVVADVGFNYALIGHGGDLGGGNVGKTLGDVDVIAGGSLLVTGGVASNDWAQIGHGGQSYQAQKEVSGEIRAAAGSCTIDAGDASLASARIGHGGNNIVLADRFKGHINVSVLNGALALSGGGAAGMNSDSQAQIGHIGNNAQMTSLGDNATGDITVTVSNGTVTIAGGDGSQGCQAQIGHGGFGGTGTLDGAVTGNVNVSASGAITLTGGTASAAIAGTENNIADIGHWFFNVTMPGNEGVVTGNTSVTSGGTVSLNGGASDNNGAYIRSFGGGLTVNVNAGNLTLMGGSASNCLAQILSGGLVGVSQSVTVANGDLSVTGGTALGCGAEIASSGTQSINVPQGSISFIANSAGGSQAQATSAGLLQSISCSGNLTLQGGPGPGTAATARILHTVAGTQMITPQGDLQLLAGAAMSNDARIISTGPLVLTVGGSATLQGGSAMTSIATVVTAGALGTQTIDIGQNLTLEAGTGMSSDARITNSASQSITLGGDLHAIGGQGVGAGTAFISTTLGNNGTITSTGGSVIFRNGTPQANAAYFQSILVPGPGATINAAGDIALANDLSSASDIVLNANSTGSGQGAFFVDTRAYPSFGGAPGPVLNGITLTTTTGALTIRAASKNANGSTADFFISTPMDFSALPLQPCMVASMSGNILVDPFHDVTINAPISTLGDITILADNNMTITPTGSVSSANTTLVVDEQGQGGLIGGIWDPLGGHFILQLGGTVTGTSSIRIFTAVRANNTIDGATALNGVMFVPGTLFVDTGTEQWFTYFGGPNNAFIGPNYMIYYKNFPASLFVPFLTTASAQIFTMCEPYDSFLRWSLNFTEGFKDQLFDPYTINRRIGAEQHNPKTDRVKKWDE